MKRARDAIILEISPKYFSTREYGTAVLVGLAGYVVIDTVRNPQSTSPGVTELVVAIEIFQIAYVIITAKIIIAKKDDNLNIK